MDPRPTADAPDDDPHLWLENVEGAEAVAWVERQNARTLERFADAGYAQDREALAAILDRPDHIPIVTRRKELLFNFWKDATNPRGLWRTTTLDSFRSATPHWEVLLDLDALAAAENEDWVWGGATTIPGTHDLAILRLSRGGGDAAVLREFDTETCRFVLGGFSLTEGKSGATWLDRDTLLLASALGEGMATTSGYARTVRLWRRGGEALESPVIFEAPATSMGVFADRDRESGFVWFVERSGFYDMIVWIGDSQGPKTKIDLPTDAIYRWHRGWLVVKPRTPWTVDGETHAPDTVLGISFAAFLAGDRRFVRLWQPSERRSFQSFAWSGSKLLLTYFDDLRPVAELLTPGAGEWHRESVPGLPQNGIAHVWSLDMEEEESTGDLLASIQDPLTPASFLLIEPGRAPEVLKRAPRTFNTDGMVVSRHDAVSIDGVRIPYFQIGPTAKTGEAPVHLYGYGGFGISQLPHYDSAIGKLWLEKGGTHVVACLRGGGEFGTPWHEAGRCEGKRLSHDDFAAVAADLVRRGVTRPNRIAAEGASNAGILITNMLTRYPERFGALFCTIPLIDMRRYSKLLAGASWIAEYGDPDKPEDWKFLAPMSAYHQAVPGKAYPPILLATTRRDDRVHPGHARKMTAKLQAMGCDAWLFELAAGGHSYGKDNRERAGFTALGYAFLRRSIGWK
jgi:prolyl oligopeptidase